MRKEANTISRTTQTQDKQLDAFELNTKMLATNQQKKHQKLRFVAAYKDYKNDEGFQNVKKKEVDDYFTFKRKQEITATKKKEDEDLKKVWAQLSDKEKSLLEHLQTLIDQQQAIATRFKDLAFNEFLGKQ